MAFCDGLVSRSLMSSRSRRVAACGGITGLSKGERDAVVWWTPHCLSIGPPLGTGSLPPRALVASAVRRETRLAALARNGVLQNRRDPTMATPF